MKRALKISAAVLFAASLAVQLYRPDLTNPPTIQSEILESSTHVPENVRHILTRSCNDCHSNQTAYPWYSNVSPVSWLLADHINEGRRELNFSVWNTYSAKKKRNKFDEICEQVTDDLMPYDQYLWIHRDARLTEEDKKILCDWAEAEKGKISDE